MWMNADNLTLYLKTKEHAGPDAEIRVADVTELPQRRRKDDMADLLERVRREAVTLAIIGTITLPTELHHELVAEIERLRKEVEQLAREVDRPANGLYAPGLIAIRLRRIVSGGDP